LDILNREEVRMKEKKQRSTRTSLLLVLLGTIALCAATGTVSAEVGFFGAGARISYVKPDTLDATMGLGAHMDLGTLFDVLWIYPSIEYWGKSLTEETLNLDVTSTEVSFNLDVRVIPPMPLGKVLPYVGGGGCAIINAISTAFYDPFYGLVEGSDTKVRWGYEGFAGISVPLFGVTMFLEGKYRKGDMELWRITGGFTLTRGH
jgi:hypothetical protein